MFGLGEGGLLQINDFLPSHVILLWRAPPSLETAEISIYFMFTLCSRKLPAHL